MQVYIKKVGYRKYRVGIDVYVAMDNRVKHDLQIGHAKSKTKAYELAKDFTEGWNKRLFTGAYALTIEED
tara:strand:- start:391 stop:600 length:210 start_codon:yes stop_codon:yes gene_type:complete